MKGFIKKLLREAIVYHGHKIPVGDVFLNNNIHGGPDGPNWELSRKIDVFTTDADFEKNPIEVVNIRDIVPTQKFLNKDNLDDVKKNEKDFTGAYLVKYEGKYFIIDGHHRIANKIMNGANTVKAYVQNIEGDELNEQLELPIMKNMEPAPNMGSRFGQDVEPAGTYVSHFEKGNNPNAPNHKYGKALIKKPLFIDVNDDTLIQYKRELADKYKAKGKTLTKKLMNQGYDALITRRNYKGKEYYGEIVLFPNSQFILN